MQPIHELLVRIRHDPEFGRGELVIGYFDLSAIADTEAKSAMSAVATVQRLRHPPDHEGRADNGVPAQGTFTSSVHAHVRRTPCAAANGGELGNRLLAPGE
jgi:hypothetical protein